MEVLLLEKNDTSFLTDMSRVCPFSWSSGTNQSNLIEKEKNKSLVIQYEVLKG